MVQLKQVEKPKAQHCELIVLTRGGGAVELLFPSRAEAVQRRDLLSKALHNPNPNQRVAFFSRDMRGLELEIFIDQVAGWILRPVYQSPIVSLLESIAEEPETPSTGE